MLRTLCLLALSFHFVDVAERSGLDFVHVSGSSAKSYILESISGGVSWIDYNRDGWLDLYPVNGGRWEDLAAGKRSVANALYRNNRDGTFTNVTGEAGVAGTQWGMGAAVGDFDNDGWSDLYVCNYGPNTLYRNRGDGSFQDVSLASGTRDAHWSSGAAFGDYDQDGLLDLYVANYVTFDHEKAPPPNCSYQGIEVQCGPKGLGAEPDVLYRNRGDGSFEDVIEKAGVSVPPAWGMQAVWLDYDNDADLDLYVANDSAANFLFENEGDGKFQEVGGLSGAAYTEDGETQAGMGIAVGDYDGDGFFDLYVTNFSDDYNTLYRNQGDKSFLDTTHEAQLGFGSWRFLGWGTGFFDFDADGWEDLFVSNGHVYPQVEEYGIGTKFLQRKIFFRNLGKGRFQEIAGNPDFGLSATRSSRGAAFADFDNDGDIDVAVNNMDASPSLFLNQGGNRGRWLMLGLEGRVSNRSGIGARVSLQLDGGASQIREVRGGSSYQGSDDPRVHFGLTQAASVSSLSVRWPSGQIQNF